MPKRSTCEQDAQRALEDCLQGEDELEAVVEAWKEAEADEFHNLAEPARRVASDFRRVGRDKREDRLAEYLARLHAAIDEAVARARTDDKRKQLQRYGDSFVQRFFRSKAKRQ
jgi:hypothetical protein